MLFHLESRQVSDFFTWQLLRRERKPGENSRMWIRMSKTESRARLTRSSRSTTTGDPHTPSNLMGDCPKDHSIPVRIGMSVDRDFGGFKYIFLDGNLKTSLSLFSPWSCLTDLPLRICREFITTNFYRVINSVRFILVSIEPNSAWNRSNHQVAANSFRFAATKTILIAMAFPIYGDVLLLHIPPTQCPMNWFSVVNFWSPWNLILNHTLMFRYTKYVLVFLCQLGNSFSLFFVIFFHDATFTHFELRDTVETTCTLSAWNIKIGFKK